MKPLFMTTMLGSLLGSLLCCAPLSLAVAQTCSKQSPAHTVALLELYTSEGCSSCPPADHTVSALHEAANADLVVPLALHVDYWDDIGWIDRFAKHDFTLRQRWLTELARSRTVYTPEVFIDGHELRDWSDTLARTIGDTNRQAPRANIGIELGSIAGGKLPVAVKTNAAQGNKLFIALYENGLSSNIKAGENSGVVLRHDFVVRDWIGPLTLTTGASGDNVLTRELSVPATSISKHLGVAAFVQDNRGDVLQALALPLCGG